MFARTATSRTGNAVVAVNAAPLRNTAMRSVRRARKVIVRRGIARGMTGHTATVRVVIVRRGIVRAVTGHTATARKARAVKAAAALAGVN